MLCLTVKLMLTYAFLAKYPKLVSLSQITTPSWVWGGLIWGVHSWRVLKVRKLVYTFCISTSGAKFMLSFVVAVISTQMSPPWTLWPKFLPLTTLTINSPVILLFEMTIVLRFGLEKSSITISVRLWTHLKWCSFAHSMKLWRNPYLSLLFKRKLIPKSNSA